MQLFVFLELVQQVLLLHFISSAVIEFERLKCQLKYYRMHPIFDKTKAVAYLCEIFSYSRDVGEMIPTTGHHFVNLFLQFQSRI